MKVTSQACVCYMGKPLQQTGSWKTSNEHTQSKLQQNDVKGTWNWCTGFKCGTSIGAWEPHPLLCLLINCVQPLLCDAVFNFVCSNISMYGLSSVLLQLCVINMRTRCFFFLLKYNRRYHWGLGDLATPTFPRGAWRQIPALDVDGVLPQHTLPVRH